MLNVETVLRSCVLIWTDYDCLYLKHSQKGLGEVVKGTPLGLGLVKVELPTKDLHAQQREDDDEEEEQQQQGGDGLHGVQQRSHQVAQGLPVTVNNHRGAEMSESQVIQWAPHIHSTHTHTQTHTHTVAVWYHSHRVTLKILNRRTQRNTEIPSGDMISSSTRMVSVIPPHTTKQSKRLNSETKYACRPRLYIFTNISHVKRASSTLLATSETQREDLRLKTNKH